MFLDTLLNIYLVLFQELYEMAVFYSAPVGLSYLWNFGSLALVSLLIQIISGVFLAMFYSNSIDLAFNSIEHFLIDYLINKMDSNDSSIVISSQNQNNFNFSNYLIDNSDSENPKKTFFDIFIKIPLNFILNKLGFIENSSSILTEEKKILPEDLIVLSENQKSKTNIFNFSMNDNLWRYHFYSNSGFIFKFKFEENLVQSNLIEGNLIEENLIQSNLIQEIQITENPIQENIIQEIQISENPIQENLIQENLIQENPIQENPIQENPNLDLLVLDNTSHSNIITIDTPFINTNSRVVTLISPSIFEDFLTNITNFRVFLGNMFTALTRRYIDVGGDISILICTGITSVGNVDCNFQAYLDDIPVESSLGLFIELVDNELRAIDNLIGHRRHWINNLNGVTKVCLMLIPYIPDNLIYKEILEEICELKVSLDSMANEMLEERDLLSKYVNEEISKNVPFDKIIKGLSDRTLELYTRDIILVQEFKNYHNNIMEKFSSSFPSDVD